MAPTKKMKSKNVDKKVVDKKVVEEKVVEEKVVEEKVVDEKVVEEEKTEIDTLRELIELNKVDRKMVDDFAKQLLAKNKEIDKRDKLIINSLKKIEKDVKKGRKKTRKNNSSGFDKPVVLTDIATTFVVKNCKNYDKEAVLTRRNVNQYIHAYIKDNGLQNPENKRVILPDKNLQKILGKLNHDKKKDGTTDFESGYTYFNLQRYIKDIFVKPVV